MRTIYEVLKEGIVEYGPAFGLTEERYYELCMYIDIAMLRMKLFGNDQERLLEYYKYLDYVGYTYETEQELAFTMFFSTRMVCDVSIQCQIYPEYKQEIQYYRSLSLDERERVYNELSTQLEKSYKEKMIRRAGGELAPSCS